MDHSHMNHDMHMDDMSGMEGMSGMNTDDQFCTGNMGMVMYMEGFRWTLQGGHSCINLYFPSWTLDTKGKVIGAMIGVLILAMATEAISKLRHHLSVKTRLVATSQATKRRLSVIQTILHGAHALTGYIVMLATMTFSLELLLCVIFGLTLGYACFGGYDYSHVSTNPCCAFLEEEAQERGNEPQVENSLQFQTEGACCGNEDPDVENTELNASETGSREP